MEEEAEKEEKAAAKGNVLKGTQMRKDSEPLASLASAPYMRNPQHLCSVWPV